MPRWHASWVSIHRSKVCLWFLGGGIDELSFTYYAAVRSIELHAETEGLHMGVLLVLQLLAATMLAQLVPHLSRTCWGRQMGQMRHGCSSSTTAMTIGYYAFQASNLQLLEVRAGGLLGSKAPWYHPMVKHAKMLHTPSLGSRSDASASFCYWLMREPLRSIIAASHVLLSAKAKAKSLLTWGRFPFWTILTNISQNIVESTNYSIFLGRSFNDFLRNYCAELRRCLKWNKLMLTFKLRG